MLDMCEWDAYVCGLVCVGVRHMLPSRDLKLYLRFLFLQGVPKKVLKLNVNISEMGEAFDKIFET